MVLVASVLAPRLDDNQKRKKFLFSSMNPTMTSNQHFDYDDDSGSHIEQRHSRRGGGDYGGDSMASADVGGGNNASSEDGDGGGGGRSGDVDPCLQQCHAYASSNTNCIAALESSVDHMTMSCGGIPTDFLRFRPSNYFNYRRGGGDGGVGRGGGGGNDDDYTNASSYPQSYSPCSLIGPTSCEYCGASNIADCRGGNDFPPLRDVDDNEEDATKAQCRRVFIDDDAYVVGEYATTACRRPRLFFLKKRPPFATPDGWNPITEYRNNLFEPPSTMEGLGRGRGEVRGNMGVGGGGGGGGLGGMGMGTAPTTTGGGGGGVGCGGTTSSGNVGPSTAGTTGETPTMTAPMTPMTMTNGGCGEGVCLVGVGGVCGAVAGRSPELGVSRSSAGGGVGRGGDVVRGGISSDRRYGATSKNGNGTDVGQRSPSRVSWAWSSLMGALSPSKV
jgi:hypothetical protein